MFFVGNLKIGHDDVVGGVGPGVVDRKVGTICLAGKVESLNTELIILLKEGSPLNGSYRPVKYIFVYEVVIGVTVLSPLNYVAWLANFHCIAGILIYISLILQITLINQTKYE